MYVNLHDLPSGLHLYTVAVTQDEPGTPRDEIAFEEVDIVASSRANVDQILDQLRASDDRDEYVGSRVVHIADQSTGDVLFNDPSLSRLVNP